MNYFSTVLSVLDDSFAVLLFLCALKVFNVDDRLRYLCVYIYIYTVFLYYLLFYLYL